MTVNKAKFVREMALLWEGDQSQGGLGNVCSSALQDAWGVLCQTLNDHVAGKIINRWSVLPLPTGSGKTQALCLYCSLLAEKTDKHSGALIVTRFTQEADALEERINQLCVRQGKKAVALAFHSAHSAEAKEDSVKIQDTPIAIITHSRYSSAMALEAQGQRSGAAEQILKWKNGVRKLVVIDEYLDVIESIQISLDELRLLRALVPIRKEKELSAELIMIDGLIRKMTLIAQSSRKWEPNRIRDHSILKPEDWQGGFPHQLDWRMIQKFFSACIAEGIASSRLGAEITKELDKWVRQVIQDLQIASSGPSWIAEEYKGTPILSSPYVPLPTEKLSAVVLDATAQKHHVYRLLSPFAEMVPIPECIRSYRNVRLHIREASFVGKEMLAKQDVSYFKDVIDREAELLGKDRSVLFCAHKIVEEKLGALKTKFKRFHLSHWGNIDGKNDWKDCDTIIILGLPTLNEVTPNDTIFAFQLWKNRALGTSSGPGVNTREEPERRQYKTGYTVTSLVQAINRIHCRKVIDRDGNCPHTDVVLFMKKEDKRNLLPHIQELMPMIEVIEDQEKDIKKPPIATKLSDAVSSVLEGIKQGEHPAKKIKEQIEKKYGKPVSLRNYERIISEIKITDSNLGIAAKRLGVSYVASVGRKGGSFFIKK